MGRFKHKLIGISVLSVLFCSIFAWFFFSYNAQNTDADRFGMIHEKNILLNNSNSNLETNTNVQSNIALNINERADVPNLQDDYTNPSVSNMNDYQIAKPEDANFECLGSDDPEEVAYEKLINAKRNKQYLQFKNDDDTTVTFYYKYEDKTLHISANKIDVNYVEVIQKSSDIPGDPVWFVNNKSMEAVVVENNISPLYTTSWFSPCNEANAKKFPISHLKTISGLGNLDMSNVRDTSYMFTGVGSEKSNCFPVLKSTDNNSDNAYWSDNELTMNSLVSARAMFALSLINAGFKAGNAIDGGGLIVVKTTGGFLTDTGYMFQKCAMWNGRADNEKILNLSNFNMSNVVSADYMLNWVRGYEIDDDSKLPYYCEDTQINNLVMGSVNVGNLINAKSMLSGNSKLSYIDLSRWNGAPDSNYQFGSMFADDDALDTIFVAEGTDWSRVSGNYMFAKGSKTGYLDTIGGRGSKVSEVKSNNASHAFVDGKLNPKGELEDDEKGYFTTEYTITPDTNKLQGPANVKIPQGAQWLVDTKNKTITIVDGNTELAKYVPADSQAGKLMTSASMPGDKVLTVVNNDFLVKSGQITADFEEPAVQYKATVIKGEGEVFNAIELEDNGWDEDTNGNWYKEFTENTSYSKILKDWGDASSWSTATSVTKPGTKLNEIKTDDTDTKLVKNTDFYATWTPIDTILTNPDLEATNPVGIFNDFSSGTTALLKSNSEILASSNYLEAKAEGDRRNEILVAASTGEDVSDADMGWACSAEETPEVAYAGDENRNPQRFTLMDTNGTSVKEVEFVGAYIDNTDPDNPVVISPEAPKEGTDIGQYEGVPIDVSYNGSGGIKAYKVHIKDYKWKLVVHSYGYIYSNSDSCAYMFYNFKETDSINTNKLHFEGTTIDGQTYPGVTNTTHMFYDCQSMKGFGTNNVNASNFDTSKVTDMGHMFYNCLQATYITMPYNYFKTDNVVNMKSMFANCQAVTSLDCSHFNTSMVSDTSYMFYQCYKAATINIANQAATGSDPEYWNTSSITNMSHMFHECRVVTSLSVGGWKTGNVQNFENLFYNCKEVTTFNVFNWDTISATTMKSMFNRCYAWEGSISFGSVPSTETWQSGPLDKWDTRNVTNMAYMFYDCAALTSIDVQRFITCIRYGTEGNYTYKGVEDMYMMFRGCKTARNIYTTPYNANEKKIESGCWVTRACKCYAYMFHQCWALTQVRTSQFMVAPMRDDGTRSFQSLHWIPSWDESERKRTSGWGFQSMFAGYTDDITKEQYYMDKLTVIYNNDSTASGATNCNWWNGVGAPTEQEASDLGWDCRFHSMFFNCSVLQKRKDAPTTKYDGLPNANNMYGSTYDNAGYFTKL